MESPSLSASPPTPNTIDQTPSQPLSLQQIFRLHPRERLLVHPLEWTSRHLELLQCSFDRPLPASRKRKLINHEPPFGPGTAAGLAHRLASSIGLGSRRYAIRRLLTEPGAPFDSTVDGFFFHYKQRRVGRMRCISYSLITESNARSLPIAAWTDYDAIKSLRYDVIGPGRTGDRRNPPVERLTMLQMKAVIPANPWHDPYILALLISVAQGQRIRLRQRDKQSETLSYRAHVIYTDYKDKEHVHLFTADIPSAFLDRFEYPDQAPTAPAPVSIRHTTVPFKPYKRLYSRLLVHILPDSHPYISKGKGHMGKTVDEAVKNIAPEKQQEGVEQVGQEMQGGESTKQCQDDG